MLFFVLIITIYNKTQKFQLTSRRLDSRRRGWYYDDNEEEEEEEEEERDTTSFMGKEK